MQATTLDGKSVLITGASGGLGRPVTAAFLDAGANVTAAHRSADGETHERLARISADLMTFEGAQGAVRATIERWGRIDALVHLIGGFAGGQSVADTNEAVLNHMLDLNLRSALHIFQAALPTLRVQSRGRILAIGSRAAVEPSPMSGAYAASKAALVSLIRTIAAENADRGITANVILPGTMDTPANRASMPSADVSQWVPPAQVAGLLVHLAGDGASAINGAVIPVYGGGV